MAVSAYSSAAKDRHRDLIAGQGATLEAAFGSVHHRFGCFGRTKGAFAGFDLDGVSLKPDDSGSKTPYAKPIKNSEIVESTTTPTAAQPLVSKLAPLVHSESPSAK